ncbi:MAG TPA: Gmad2 immunoglobulin-like domain-containing protein [Pseudonocardia sp.]|nr:Gmad2 immunoglobulin-like domain-containing protein [Pseudonocardia sp.]
MRQVLVVAVVAAVLGGCADGQPGVTPVPAPPTTGPASPAPAAGEQRSLPVYYVADTPNGLRLHREFRSVTTTDPASDALRAMLAAPTGTDPDYRNLWPAGTTLAAPVAVGNGVITVDLTEQALDGSGLGTPAGEAAVNQLLFTVQAALQSSDPVRILVEGEPVDELWGAVSTADPIPRPDQYAVRSLVQIDSPAHGATVGTEVQVTGEAAAFEATVPWEVLRDGEVVRSGFAMAAEGQRFSRFTFTVTLEPGDYVVRVTEDDPSGGEGRPPFTDDKAITVTG